MGLDISRISKDYNSNIIGRHRNMFIVNEGRNKASNTYLYTTNCSKLIYNDLLNLNINRQGSIFERKCYGKIITLKKDRKEIQPVVTSRK